jgi:hypothetical protein
MAIATETNSIKKHSDVVKLASKLLLERSAFDDHFRQLNDFILPRRTRFQTSDDDQNKDRRSLKIVDGTATRAARTLQSGLHSGVTSPARPWFRLTTPDPDLAEFGPVKEWLHQVTSRMLTVFLRSNIYNVLPTLYGDLGVFGSPAMGVFDDDKELLRGYSFPIGAFAYACSDRGLVDTFWIEYKMSVRQLIETFSDPENPDWSLFSRTVRTMWRQNNTESKVDVSWMILPNPEADPERFESRYKPWASLRWEKGGEKGVFLQESGFDEFPILAPRWHVTGRDWYASDCPGMTALPDVKSLQIMQRRKAQAEELLINPALQGPTSLQSKKVSLRPGEMTYVDFMTNANAMVKPIREIEAKGIQFILADIQDVRAGINESFFKDLFMMISQMDQQGANPRMTATEILKRQEEKLMALGPVYERMNDELLDPLVDRGYAMMDRAGMIPDPPQELQGVKLKVEYISVLAQAMKTQAVSATNAWLQSTVPLMEMSPIVKHKIDFAGVVDEFGDLYGVNPKLIIPTEDAQKAAQAEAAAMQKQQQAEQAETMSKTAKNLSGSNLDDNNALQRVLEGASA